MNKEQLSFWNWEQWQSLWPSFRPEVRQNFDISACSRQFKEAWLQDEHVLAIMTQKSSSRPPVTIADIRSLARRMEAWITSPESEECLTIPPTVKGFQQAIEQEIRKKNNLFDYKSSDYKIQPQSVLFALAILRPGDVAMALSNVPDHALVDDLLLLKKQNILQLNPSLSQNVSKRRADQSDSSTAPAAPIEPQKAVVEVEAAPAAPASAPSKEGRAPKPQFELPAKHIADGKRFEQWIEEIEQARVQQSLPLSVLKETLNSHIKKDVVAIKGIGEQSLNYWFEDVAFYALCALPVETVQKVLDYWPEHTNVTWNSPVLSMENQLFWRALRTLKGPSRSFMMEDVLPRLVDGSQWGDQERHQMLQSMVDKTQAHGWLFEERLKLWCAWGGDLDKEIQMKSPQPSSESMFAPVVTQSARQWIVAQGVPAWDEVLKKLDHPPRIPKM